ncbi:MAG TPA: uroporphyrinogen decarboxylase family protein [Spirochaetia bacterium]|nr:uroporphyrinogen decarboxylase family protein [Spirochaetia bacterium]
MTNRERMFKTFNHENADRIPSAIHARGEVQRALAEYYGVLSYREVLRLLGADTYGRLIFDAAFPGFKDKTTAVLRGDCPGAGNRYIFHDTRTFEDGWGVIRRVGRDGKYVEWVTGPLAEAGDPDEYAGWSELEKFSMQTLYEGEQDFCDSTELSAFFNRIKSEDLVVQVVTTQPYKTAWLLRGMENVLADYLINRPFLEKLYDRIFHIAGEILRRCTQAGADIIGFDGDIAMQDRVIMGPESWRAVDKPRLAELLASCKAINPDVVTFIHSDGDVSEILPDLIEVGFEVIDPIQPECMDPAEVKRLYGEQITLHGCGSLQRTLPFGSPADCRQEVIHLIERCGRGGGLVLRVSNNMDDNIPMENIASWYETARDYVPSYLKG